MVQPGSTTETSVALIASVQVWVDYLALHPTLKGSSGDATLLPKPESVTGRCQTSLHAGARINSSCGRRILPLTYAR